MLDTPGPKKRWNAFLVSSVFLWRDGNPGSQYVALHCITVTFLSWSRDASSSFRMAVSAVMYSAYVVGVGKAPGEGSSPRWIWRQWARATLQLRQISQFGSLGKCVKVLWVLDLEAICLDCFLFRIREVCCSRSLEGVLVGTGVEVEMWSLMGCWRQGGQR